ncbi:hypothetical protein BMW23_0511 [Bodo saltans virus]|jgi:hypothetical protein|uniref:Uncharacterized protein n=1 Tax=Bodo saltans virus TaxID=2024608 RepID=A0A2H4UUG9_9VIRU|nr:hypothetical protein QJ851_gp0495 [Bodo saltans virus]ATZ80558.1 hypothetical protein BMW23_0511 [Bodo saltans virus]
MYKNPNRNDIFENLIILLLNKVTHNEIFDGVNKLTQIIPNSEIVNELINNPENKKSKICVAYDEYIYHDKYENFDAIKFDNLRNEFDNNAKYVYIEICSWLLNEVESMIRVMTNDKMHKNIVTKKYDEHYETKLGFITKDNFYFSLPETAIEWNELQLLYPFDVIKKQIELKGYTLKLLSDKTNERQPYTLELSILNKRPRE